MAGKSPLNTNGFSAGLKGSPQHFFKPAQHRFTNHFPAGVLHRLTLYTSYEPQVPELDCGTFGNLKSLVPSCALPRESLGLRWLRQQSHIPLLTCANNTHAHAATNATKWAKKEDNVITSLNCHTTWCGSSPLHVRILHLASGKLS